MAPQSIPLNSDSLESEPSLKRALKASLIAHLALFLIIVIRSLVFPSETKPYIPSLRVDLVGLPDQLKSDLDRLKTLPPAPDSASTSAQTPAESEALPQEDELVLKPKKKKKANTDKTARESDAERKARTHKALARIKALNRISEADSESTQDSALVKGNTVSKGTALTGDARENAQEQYYDVLLQRMQSNWTLPVWLSRQDHSAQVQVFIDAKGNVRTLKFVKSSGNTQFDEAVRRAIAASEPFPAPPIALRSALLSNGILFGFPL